MDPLALSSANPRPTRRRQLNLETANRPPRRPSTTTQRPPVYDVVVFSHLRWDFVFQRPQHLLTRCAREGRRVFYVEEPHYGAPHPALAERLEHGVRICTPHLPHASTHEHIGQQAALMDRLIAEHRLESYISWYYTPMALPFTTHLAPQAIVFDAMDELSLFQGAPPQLLEHEATLLGLADVVFTGGQSLFQAKRHRHDNVHAFPSSIEAEHFRRARIRIGEPADQAAIPGKRIGFYGVLDERLDRDLLAATACLRPDWHFIMIGPVVKIDPSSLPTAPNIHYLGMKKYAELPEYLAGWDVAMLPFAINDSTRFISPTKTPEYLAAGRPVVSTPITDVVEPYGRLGLVRIAGDPTAFAQAIDQAAADGADPRWQERRDAFIGTMSWDRTWQDMRSHIDRCLVANGDTNAA